MGACFDLLSLGQPLNNCRSEGESGLRWPQLHRPQLSVTESGSGHNRQTFKDSVEEVELDYVLARFGIGFDKVRLI